MIYGDYDLPSRDPSGRLKPLEDGQFDIGGLTFGGEHDGITLDSFQPNEPTWDVRDVDNPFGNETVFGRDYLHSPTWAWEGYTNAYDINGTLDAVDEFAQAWQAEDLKAISGTYQILRYRIGNQTRRVYGRGRKFWHSMNRKSYAGTAPVAMSFKLMSDMYFEDEARSIDMSIVPAVTGGLVAPLTAPITTVGTGAARAGVIEDVGGSVPAPFYAFIQGPVANPYIAGDGFRVQLNMELAHDQTVRISTYAGRLEVQDNFGRNYAGRLSMNTRLASARLKPGSTSITFGGVDITGTAKARVVWRPAFATL